MITIIETPLTAALKRILYHWGTDIFGTADIDLTGLRWRTFSTGFLLSVNATPVSYFRALRHVCAIDGRELEVGGLGGLVTHPAYQRRGYGRRLVKAAVAALRDEWCVAAALAFCLDPLLGFYRRLGARLITGPVTAETDSGPAPAPFNPICWPFLPNLWPIATVDLRGPLW